MIRRYNIKNSCNHATLQEIAGIFRKLQEFAGIAGFCRNCRNLQELQESGTPGRDRTTGGGGVMCLVSHSCTFSEWDTSDIISNDGTTEVLGVEVRLGGSLLRIVNTYIPPASSCPTGYSPHSMTSVMPEGITF